MQPFLSDSETGGDQNARGENCYRSGGLVRIIPMRRTLGDSRLRITASVLILLVGAFTISVLKSVSCGSVEPVRAYQVQRPIVIDGKYNMTLIKGKDHNGNGIWIDEWNQTETKMMFTLYPESMRPGTGYFPCAYDETHLYVLWDFVSCKTKLDTQRNSATVCVGTSYQNRTRPDNSYDFMFIVEWFGKGPYEGRLVGFIWFHSGDAWHSGDGISSGDRGFFFASDLGKSPHSSEQHLVFEAKIPLFYAVRGAGPSLGIRTGISELNLAKEYIVVSYPNDSSVQVPNQWADLKLVTVAIPEFSSEVLISAIVLAFASILSKNHRARALATDHQYELRRRK